MNNPFHESFEDAFRGHRVTATSTNGETYTGVVERLHHHDRHIVLRGAHRGTAVEAGVHVGRAFVAEADSIELAPDDPAADEQVERVALDTITPSPYACQGYVYAENADYIERIATQGMLDSAPTVRPINGDDHRRDRGRRWEIVAGHKRVWMARRAGLDSHAVEVIDCDDWTAARRFAGDHLPAPWQVRSFAETTESEQPTRGSPQARKADAEGRFIVAGKYGDANAREAIGRLVDRWGNRAADLPQLAFNARRLGVDHEFDVNLDLDGVDDDRFD